MNKITIWTETSPGMAQPRPLPRARPRVGPRIQAPGGSPPRNGARPGSAQKCDMGPATVGSPPAGGTVRGRCIVDQEAVEGRGLDNPISGHRNCLWNMERHLAGGEEA